MSASARRARSGLVVLLLALGITGAWWLHAAIEQSARPFARQGLGWLRNSMAGGLLERLYGVAVQPAAAPRIPAAQARRELQRMLASLPWKAWDGQTPRTPRSAHGTTFYVSPHGSDSHDGRSPRQAFATPQAAANVARAGDTVLIAAGLYRGTLIAKASGRPGAPITFGSDGSGPVIIDGSPPVRGWKRLRGSVWSAPIDFQPIAVIADAQALRPSLDGVQGVTSGSGRWAVAAGMLVADFATSLGDGDPAAADIVVPRDDGAQTVVYFYDAHDLVFNGLTVRGSGASGIWGYGSDITVSHCNLEFNGKAGINFMPMQGNANAGNRALDNRVYMNVLLNWPRGNNGFAASGGGWSGGLVFAGSLDGVARGNLVYDNGGEGMISFGSGGGRRTGGTVFEHNVVFDNWSVNMYFDNQPDDTARGNIVFNHPVDPGQWLRPPSAGYPWNELYKFSVCLMLADEVDSSGGPANLDRVTVVDNLVAGCRIGIRDYAEGHLSTPHGLKHALIANNTIVLPLHPLPFGTSTYTAGLQLLGERGDSDSLVANNAVLGYADDAPLVWLMRTPPPDAVRLENNFYADSATPRALWLGSMNPRRRDLAGWQQATGNDHASRTGSVDSLRGDVAGALARGGFFTLDDARPRPGSALIGTGVDLSKRFDTSLDGSPRNGSWDIGALR